MEEKNNISQELLETIERYLKNTMKSDERIGFEQRMTEDPILSQQVEDTAILFSGIKKAVFKNKLDAIHSGLVVEKASEKVAPKVFKLNFRTLSIAASAVILIGSFWFFNQPSKNEKLFNNYFEKPMGLPTVMGGNRDNFELLDAMVEYKIGDYDSAIERWEALLANNKTNDTLQFYLGAAYLAKRNQEMAIPYLKKVIDNDNSHFQNSGFYYLGIAYVKDEKWDLAKEMLKRTTNSKAKELINELK